jgi:uncharacterized protein DUF6851
MDSLTIRDMGSLAATSVLRIRHHDGSNQLGNLHPGAYSDYTGYVPINDPDHIANPDHWQPLLVPDGHGGYFVQKFSTPQWGRVKPFALDELKQHLGDSKTASLPGQSRRL